MKRIILTLTLFVSLSSSAQLSIGASSGYTRAWQNYGDITLPDDAVTHIHGFNAELQVYYKFGRFLSVGIEPAFTRRGAACVPGWNLPPEPLFDGDSRFLLDYVEAPVMIQGNFDFFNERLFVQPALGYGWSVMARATEEVVNLNTGDVEITREMPIGFNTNMNRWDHGFHGALKVGWKINRHSIFAQSSYYFGLRSAEIWNVSKNRALNLNLGYSFSFK